MNKKYYIYSLITFGLILISYFLYNYFDEKNKNPIEIHIYSFNNSESFTKEQINEIKSYFDENNFSHIIYLHTPKNKNDKEVIILKPSGIRVQDEYKNNFNRAIDSLSKIVYLYPNISKNESNYLVNHFITNVNKGTYKNKRVFVLTGNFPINYTNKDVTELNLKDKLKKKKLDNDNLEINWAIKSNENEPEQIYFNQIKNAGYAIKNNTQISELRANSTHLYKPIYIIMMSPITSNEIFDLTNYIRLYYGTALRITIWNNSKFNNYTFLVNDDNYNIKDSLKFLEELNIVQWDNFGKLIKEATFDISEKNFTYKVPLIFLGNMPKVGQSIQLNEETWQTLKDTKNIDIICYMPKGKTLNETDLLFREGLRISNIHFIERQ